MAYRSKFGRSGKCPPLIHILNCLSKLLNKTVGKSILCNIMRSQNTEGDKLATTYDIEIYSYRYRYCVVDTFGKYRFNTICRSTTMSKSHMIETHSVSVCKAPLRRRFSEAPYACSPVYAHSHAASIAQCNEACLLKSETESSGFFSLQAIIDFANWLAINRVNHSHLPVYCVRGTSGGPGVTWMSVA